MFVSVIVCTYAPERYEHFVDTVESVLAQTYDQTEVVIVVDGTEAVFERAQSDFGSLENVIITCNNENSGVSASRTRGARLANGDVVAFIDDDAVASPDWIETLVEGYDGNDVLAVGGRMIGDWIDGRPWYLPDEFNWLVGVTHRGFASSGDEVRNTFESNLSFRREVFLELGGFNPDLGPTAETYSHSEGAEIGTRLQQRYGCGVKYVSGAVVQHKVFEHRTSLRWLLARAFKQGQSKHRLKRQQVSESDEESSYLRMLGTKSVPSRFRSIVSAPALEKVGQLLMLFVFTGAVGIGYLHASVQSLVVHCIDHVTSGSVS